MKIKAPHLDMDAIEEKAQDIALELVKSALPSEDEISAIVDKLAVWLDGQISYGDGVVAKFVDAHDDGLIKFLLHMVVGRIVAELKDAGAFE